ncbi:hypothetical protein Csp2054_07785 [Curtobacterium sp. 'Ferrero']|uniref:LysM peptidoglycan-binding domain-containing protein n=1 Tax=Curtobacterium sp. 'Ferrero' TaxID=2033654 RepID=UPI000BC9AA6A|nr:LysM peptidoglycan-binding domain-containing protein [Curtobacterium sp. 'Ferrero']PCN48310.1 hypothetical protein Csp2054_07785 [Curtobacterium sp. 'Ferrero']
MSTIAIADTQRTAAPAVRTRLRLTRRGRVVFTTLAALPILLVVAIAVLNGGGAAAGDAAGTGSTRFETVTIQPGETLWQLAEETAPDSDPRDFVADVVNLNALDGSALQAGETISIPTKYTHEH